MNDENPLPLLSAADCSPVPVFHCHVILSRPDENGMIHGRAANLAKIEASGSSERDVLKVITGRFKAAVQAFADKSEAVPFIDPPEQPKPGELERFIPMHL